MTDLENMTDEQLIECYNDLWRRYMYYQAAEGNWRSETTAREAVNKEYYACLTEVKKRGLEV
jgi:hypothetical protein